MLPHPTLTPLIGKPTSATIKLLTREVYANARSVHSTLGGGANGHLAICMPDATYLARAGQAFVIPVHPGPQPVHAQGATGPQITAVNRQYDQDLKAFETHLAVAESIRKQILESIASTFYDVLADDTFGYADVTIVQLLTHLTSEYGTLTRTDLELNRNLLKETWNPDAEFATLWTRIKTVRQIATAGGDAISDNTTMELTLIALRQAGVYAHAIQTWDDKTDADQTYDNFKLHFSQQEKIRLRNVTAKAAGYSIVPTPDDNAVTDAVANNAQPAFVCNEVELYYCWTHGLSKNSKHTGKLCENKGEGHCDNATLENRKGGINRINFGRAGKQKA